LKNVIAALYSVTPTNVQVEVDQLTERLTVAQMKQQEKEAAVMAAEAEFNRLNRSQPYVNKCASGYISFVLHSSPSMRLSSSIFFFS
jgi:hypothetical protein